MKTQKVIKKTKLMESKKETFMDSGTWAGIVRNVQNIYTSDGTMSTLIDWERVLDEADLYAFKNWYLGEIVDGPVVGRYNCSATIMWPQELMPDPRGAKRLLPLGCVVKFKKTTIKVPIEVKSENDFTSGTNYPKLIDRKVWLVNITIPKSLMNDIREGSIELADQTVDLEDLDTAYQRDYDEASNTDEQNPQDDGMGADLGMGGMGADSGMGGMPPPVPGL